MHERVLGINLPATAALAYVGDARHALYVRERLVRMGICKSGELNEAALSYVTAEAQAAAMRRIEDRLLDDEREVYRRAYNSGHLNRPKHASAADYRAATGFEAVVGMLHWLRDEERLEELLSFAYENDIAQGKGRNDDTEN